MVPLCSGCSASALELKIWTSAVGWITSSISWLLVVNEAAPSLKPLSPSMVVTSVMGVPVIAMMDWLASKYGSLKSTASARSGRMEICAMCQSNALSPGANACSKTAFGIQSISSGAKPRAAATA